MCLKLSKYETISFNLRLLDAPMRQLLNVPFLTSNEKKKKIIIIGKPDWRQLQVENQDCEEQQDGGAQQEALKIQDNQNQNERIQFFIAAGCFLFFMDGSPS